MTRWQEIKNNQKLKDNLLGRDWILRAIRNYFHKQGFTEVETPALIKLPGMEPYLNPFKTKVYNERGEEHEAYLITSPEYAMKKLLASGFQKIFQICKCFRNGEQFDGLHNPEFTMIEWYKTDADYNDLMVGVENLILSILDNPYLSQGSGSSERSRGQNYKLKFKNLKIDFSKPFERLSLKEAFKKFCKLNLDNLLTLNAIKKAAEDKGYKIGEDFRYEDMFFKIFINEIEPNLGKNKPTFLYDYPIQLGALARAKKDNPQYAERVELYIAGLEIANGFSELTDSGEQRKRLEEEKKLRFAQNKDLYNIDEDFIQALNNLPKSAGIALGIDRLVMILLDASSIEEVISFPASTLFNSEA